MSDQSLKKEGAASSRFFKPGTALNRILHEAPYLPRCSENKTAIFTRPREYAINYSYMQINRSGMVSWLIFDIDHNNALIWKDVGLPPPNLIVQNRKNAHSHLYYAIVPVCTTEKARFQPISYMKAVYEAFTVRLNADTSFHNGPVAKTPGHPLWLTNEIHSRVYELGELADHVELTCPLSKRKETDAGKGTHSRHCILFDLLRHYAYSIANQERNRSSFQTFTRLLETYSNNCNDFRKWGFISNLSSSSLRATVKSVARWTWNRYKSSKPFKRGVMEFRRGISLLTKQKLSAVRTNKMRRKTTAHKIQAACRFLRERGKKLTQSSIAAAANLCRQTVAVYKDLLLGEKERNPKKKRAKKHSARYVNYDEYQVTTSFSERLYRNKEIVFSAYTEHIFLKH